MLSLDAPNVTDASTVIACSVPVSIMPTSSSIPRTSSSSSFSAGKQSLSRLWVVAFCLAMVGGWSTMAQAIPAAPTGLALVYSRDGSSSTYYPGAPALTWNTAAGVTWKLKRSTTSGSGYTELATGITTNSRTDSTATMGTTYYYIVTANDASGQSTNSNQITVTPRLARLTITSAHNNGQVTLSWPRIEAVGGYRIWMGNSAGTYTTLRTTTGDPASPGYVWTGLAPGSYYFIVQSAFSSNPATATPGDSPNSNERSYVIYVAPTNLAAEPMNSGALVTWDVIPGATGYRVARKTGTGGSFVDLNIVTTNSLTDNNPALTNGTQYFYNMMAFFSDGESLIATAVNCTPKVPPAAPTGVAATAGVGQVALSWTASSGATAYRVKRATVSGGPYTTLTSSVATTGYTDSGLTPGTTYYYKVGASNGAWSADSTQVSAVPLAPAPGAPAAPSISNVTNNGLRATAPILPANATSLTLQQKLTSQADTAYANVATGLAALAQTNVTGLSASTAYTFRYIAVNAGGNTSGFSVNATSLPNAPAAPQNLAATPGNGQVSLAWDTVAGATSYTVKSGPIGGPYNTTVVTDLAVTSYVQTGLINGTTYYYVVLANNAGGSSPQSNEASATLPLPPPPAPTQLTAVVVDDQVQLSWQASEGANAYFVYRSSQTGTGYNVIQAPEITTYTDSAVQRGQTYFYIVKAVNANGLSAASNEVSKTIRPLPPTNLAAIQGTASGEIALSWIASAGATAYVLERSTINGGPYNMLPNAITSSPFLDTGLTNGTSYYYRIIAMNGGGQSEQSNQGSATPQSPASVPGLPTFSNLTIESVSVTAPALPQNAQSLTLQIKTDGQSDLHYLDVSTGLGGVTTPVMNLDSGTKYYFRYIANGANGVVSGGAADVTTLRNTISWQQGDPISCEGIRWPGSNATLAAGVEGRVSAYLAIDWDIRQVLAGATLLSSSNYSDPCRYLWSVTDAYGNPVGSFKNGIDFGQSAIWIAPMTSGQYVLRLTVDDQDALNSAAGDAGNRNDTGFSANGVGFNDRPRVFVTTITVP